MKMPSFNGENIFFSSTLIFSILFLCPIIALFIISANNSDGIWEHLLETVLFKYIYNTVFLMVGVIILSLFISIIPAWLIACSLLSIEQGPAIKNKGSLLDTLKFNISTMFCVI